MESIEVVRLFAELPGRMYEHALDPFVPSFPAIVPVACGLFPNGAPAQFSEMFQESRALLGQKLTEEPFSPKRSPGYPHEEPFVAMGYQPNIRPGFRRDIYRSNPMPPRMAYLRILGVAGVPRS